MHQNSGRARTFETAIGILILVIMIATAIGIYVISQDYNMSRFGISTAGNDESEGDFTAIGTSETYNYDNLYEKINGKAPMYQETGFVKLDTQRFAAKTNSDLSFELYIYDMNSAKNAFSVYSRQKRPDAVDFNDLGANTFGYLAGNAICISSGKNYIEMIGSAESNELVNGMKEMATNLSAKRPASEKIAELEYFPQGTVAGSWKLQIDNAFGFDGLTDTYSASYKVNGKAVSIFLSKRKDADEAKAVAKNYYDFLITNGAKAVSVDSDILKSAGASIVDFYGAFEIVFPADEFVAGIHEADNKQAAEKAAEVLISRLREING